MNDKYTKISEGKHHKGGLNNAPSVPRPNFPAPKHRKSIEPEKQLRWVRKKLRMFDLESRTYNPESPSYRLIEELCGYLGVDQRGGEPE